MGNVQTRRDFTFAEDTSEGLITIAENGENGEVYNIGTGKDFSIEEVIKEIGSILGKELKIETDESKIRPEKSEVYVLQCNNEKIKSLGWEPKHNLRDGLIKTIDWFRNNKDFYKLDSNFV